MKIETLAAECRDEILSNLGDRSGINLDSCSFDEEIWEEIKTAQSEIIERALQKQRDALLTGSKEWGDRKDDLTEVIKANHPHYTKDYAPYSRAQELVSNRHSKGALIGLVSYLLGQAAMIGDAVERHG